LIIVDGKSPGTYRDLMSQVRKINKISDLPVRVLILTGAGEDRSGNVARFAAAGVPVVAHETVTRALGGGCAKPQHCVALRDSSPVRLGGSEAQVIRLPADNGGGRTIVYFPNLKVVALGEIDDPGQTTAALLAELLSLDFDVAVPSQGAPLTRADLLALKAK